MRVYRKWGVINMNSSLKHWECPACKSYKVISDSDHKCIRCSACGRHYDLKGKEITCNIYTLDMHSDCDCDIN